MFTHYGFDLDRSPQIAQAAAINERKRNEDAYRKRAADADKLMRIPLRLRSGDPRIEPTTFEELYPNDKFYPTIFGTELSPRTGKILGFHPMLQRFLLIDQKVPGETENEEVEETWLVENDPAEVKQIVPLYSTRTSTKVFDPPRRIHRLLTTPDPRIIATLRQTDANKSLPTDLLNLISAHSDICDRLTDNGTKCGKATVNLKTLLDPDTGNIFDCSQSCKEENCGGWISDIVDHLPTKTMIMKRIPQQTSVPTSFSSWGSGGSRNSSSWGSGSSNNTDVSGTSSNFNSSSAHPWGISTSSSFPSSSLSSSSSSYPQDLSTTLNPSPWRSSSSSSSSSSQPPTSTWGNSSSSSWGSSSSQPPPPTPTSSWGFSFGGILPLGETKSANIGTNFGNPGRAFTISELKFPSASGFSFGGQPNPVWSPKPFSPGERVNAERRKILRWGIKVSHDNTNPKSDNRSNTSPSLNFYTFLAGPYAASSIVTTSTSTNSSSSSSSSSSSTSADGADNRIWFLVEPENNFDFSTAKGISTAELVRTICDFFHSGSRFDTFLRLELSAVTEPDAKLQVNAPLTISANSGDVIFLDEKDEPMRGFFSQSHSSWVGDVRTDPFESEFLRSTIPPGSSDADRSGYNRFQTIRDSQLVELEPWRLD